MIHGAGIRQRIETEKAGPRPRLMPPLPGRLTSFSPSNAVQNRAERSTSVTASDA